MQNFKNTFINMVINALKILFLVLFCGVGLLTISFSKGINLMTFLSIIIFAIVMFVIYKTIKNKSLHLKNKVIIIIFIGMILRILWLINVNTQPYSDFETLYNGAIALINNDNTLFTGVNYIARFPHLSYMIVYMAVIMKLFGQAVLTIKIGNLIFSIITMYLIYKVSLEVFEEENLALVSLGISAIFAPMITYVGVLATENIAIPFYLASIYFFIKAIKKDMSLGLLALSGLLLGIGNLFRMVAVIMVIAYVMYILIFEDKKIISKIKSSIVIVIMFVSVLVSGSFLLKSLGITEVHLWKGKEPAVTNILKGSNIESFGRFNDEDAAIPEKYNYDYDKVKDVSIEIIKERLTTTSPIRLAIFYGGKFIGQWGQGDMSGISWSESGAEKIGVINSENSKVVVQLAYISIISLSFISLFNKKRIIYENKIINLFYIILCGYGCFYLISEMQGRYAYIACWVFIIFATSGVEKVFDYKMKKRLGERNEHNISSGAML
ncbi:MAG: glycosyltransferase family 39 protein [Clostridium sp.]|uniref:glycosyltransferase family 39 protein n=1 Tax=Clostridium sp. TaxID=1506 RepID=UPI0025BC00DC|nr:glycosyltransferase family 39 protein [Clostridium sp.]MBS4957412.1 glycosyltransferase family 39 protein [Clostridium sp.]